MVIEKTELISLEGMKFAEWETLKYVQQRSFKEEMSCLLSERKNDEELSQHSKRSPYRVKKSSLIYKLDPLQLDELLCVGERFRHALILEAAKHSILLPKKHRVVELTVRHHHLISGHSGQEHLLSSLREKFWIIKGWTLARNVVNRCVSCKRRQAPAGIKKIADLYADRVTPGKPPFSFVGIDCFGPFGIRRGRCQVKRYVVLFICLVTRSMHREVVQSMDTSSFVISIRRFVARIGLPEMIPSDNGKNFVGGNKEISQAISYWNERQIHESLLQRDIKLIFNSLSGSHHGGVWERCKLTVRKVLTAVTSEQTHDDEGLSTLPCEVELVVNSSPIIKSSDDPTDVEALTQNHCSCFDLAQACHLARSAKTTPILEDGARFNISPTCSGEVGLGNICLNCKNDRSG